MLSKELDKGILVDLGKRGGEGASIANGGN